MEVVGHQSECQHADADAERAKCNIVHSGYIILTFPENDVVLQPFDIDMMESGIRSSFHDFKSYMFPAKFGSIIRIPKMYADNFKNPFCRYLGRRFMGEILFDFYEKSNKI